MSKYCFLLAPVIQLKSADSNNQPMSTSLTVVEVEVFTTCVLKPWKNLNTCKTVKKYNI